MKNHQIITTFAISALTFGFAFTSNAAEEKEKIVKLSEIPAAAAAAIQKLAAGGKIIQVEEAKENGKVTYEAGIKSSGKVREVTVDAKGRLLSEEEVIALADAPKPVQATIEKEAAGGKIEKIERIKEGGKINYEALISSKNKREEIVLSEKGKVVERENKKGAKD